MTLKELSARICLAVFLVVFSPVLGLMALSVCWVGAFMVLVGKADFKLTGDGEETEHGR